MPFSDARQFLIYVQGVTGTFAKLAGGGVMTAATKAWDGGNPQAQILTGNPEVQDLTVSRPFDPARDGPILASLRGQVGRFRTTITQVYTDAAYVPVGGSDQWTGKLVDVTGPQADASKTGAAASDLSLKFACEAVR